ncbi:transposase [Pseudalkalibacillus salsuginis]|uniref:transposase n=1 Tax=Pseudalkalibacillus salsuginis TaxID=2910972 RepID=UPI003899BB03
MEYDEELDEFICANHKRLAFQAERKRTSENGYVSVQRTYRCVECIGCPFQEKCAKRRVTSLIHQNPLKTLQNKRRLTLTSIFIDVLGQPRTLVFIL